MDIKKLKEIASMFQIDGDVTSIAPLGDGLINDTFRVGTTAGGAGYVLQRINHNVFKDVAGIQRNIERVTAYIKEQCRAEGMTDTSRCTLTPVKLKGSERTYVEVGGEYWRMTVMIADSVTLTEVTERTAYVTGCAIGRFQKQLSTLPGEPLVDSIPRFHDMEFRLEELREAVAADRVGRLAGVKDLVDFIESYAERMTRPEREYRAGRLPKRVCHCDTKVSNLLFDKNGDFLCVIDLDTLMPSFVTSDYGDFLRTAACTAPEDEPDLTKVGVNEGIITAFTDGYLENATFLTPVEKELLPLGIALFPYMQGVRFLTDYLNGDTYYKTAYPEHNLVRARAQLHLFKAHVAAGRVSRS